MPDPQGLPLFPGIEQPISGQMTFNAHGISPSICTIAMVPQANLVPTGDTLRFVYDSTVIEFKGCLIDQASLQYDESGQQWQVSIWDRRWRWVNYGKISGFYNLRKADGSLDTTTEKSPQDLAKLLLKEMGEDDYDVSAMPNDTRPRKEWNYSNPAAELSSLAEEVGCRVVFDYLSDSVKILPVGIGAALPTDGALNEGFSLDTPEKPKTLVMVCGENLWQVDLLLEAVGLDSDNSIKPIDDLSYKPSGGWTDIDPPYFENVDENYRQLAVASVFKWYRVKVPFNVPGYEEEIESLAQIRLTDSMVEKQTETLDDGTTTQTPKKALVYGIFANGTDELGNSVSEQSSTIDEAAKYTKGWSLDAKRAIVKFSEPVYKNDAATPSEGFQFAPATLRLRTAINILEAETRAPLRFVVERETDSPLDTLPRFLPKEELVLTHEPVYDGGSYSASSITTNQEEIEREANYYLDAAEDEFQTKIPISVTYIGLRAIPVDGAIQQLTFSCGQDGCTTTASRDNELLNRTVSYKERRNLERQRELAELNRKDKPSFQAEATRKWAASYNSQFS